MTPITMRPIIGVSACRRMLGAHAFHVAGEKYLQALVDGADAQPLVIPALAESTDERPAIEALLKRLDGILLTGSHSNVEPHHYDGEASEPGTLHDAHRDSVALPLARIALDRGVPLLAICRGFQELNVVLGGSLHQDVASVAGYHSHSENPDDPLDVQYGPAHAVNLVEGGQLHDLLGESTLTVNSLHHQALRKLADGVSVEALADDGLVEAFTVDDVPGFALAVQWHPEWQTRENEASMKIFKAFGDACRRHAAERQV